MKKITLLFLALSAVIFGATGTIGGENGPSKPIANKAEINVHVSAIVSGETTNLVITDIDGNEISAVYFHHELDNTDDLTSSPNVLNTGILAKASGLNTQNQLKAELINTLELTNGVSTLISNLSADAKPFDNTKGGVVYTVSSSLSGIPVEGSYAVKTTPLTITYSKTPPQTDSK
ncbi:MAG: hypothetical protein ACRDB6_07610 [Cetobacterium sp.]